VLYRAVYRTADGAVRFAPALYRAQRSAARSAALQAALWNRNYFLRFRFRLLKNYGSGSGSNFWKVMFPVPTFVKLRFRLRFKNVGKFFLFTYRSELFLHWVYKFQQIYFKMWMKKNIKWRKSSITFIFCSGSGNVINYGSGSTTRRPGPVIYLCLDCFRRGWEGRTHRSCHAYSISRRDFCLLEAAWTAGQAVRYRKSPPQPYFHHCCIIFFS
jgi:hypothetical protein